MERDYTIAAVVKALKVLKLFDIKHQEMTLTEISQLSGYNKSSTLRLLESLRAEDFIHYSEIDKKYSIGTEVFRIGAEGHRSADLRDLIYPVLRHGVDQTQMMCHAGILDGDKILVISRVWPSANMGGVSFASQVGGVSPVHCTGIGKLFLAFSERGIHDRLIAHCDFKRYTDTTITDPAVLEKELNKIRQQGYATNNSEHEPYLCCTSYPVFNCKGQIVLGISLSGLPEWIDEKRQEEIHGALREIVKELNNKVALYEI